MDLRPIYPAKPAFTAVCSNKGCKKPVESGTGFADTDSSPGTYLCVSCVTTHHMTSGKVHDLLVERDRLELQLKKD